MKFEQFFEKCCMFCFDHLHFRWVRMRWETSVILTGGSWAAKKSWRIYEWKSQEQNILRSLLRRMVMVSCPRFSRFLATSRWGDVAGYLVTVSCWLCIGSCGKKRNFIVSRGPRKRVAPSCNSFPQCLPILLLFHTRSFFLCQVGNRVKRSKDALLTAPQGCNRTTTAVRFCCQRRRMQTAHDFY